MIRFGMALAVGLAVAVVGTGCAGPAGGRSAGGQAAGRQRTSGPPAIEAAWRSCPAPASPDLGESGNEAATLPLLEDGFHPVAAVLCRTLPVRRPDGSTLLVATESRASDVTALVAALRLPDEPLTAGMCTADLILTPYLVLLDQPGRWVRPGVPVDECGKPRREVRAAIDGLRLTQTSSRTIRQIESAEAVAAGCEQQWADMAWAVGAGAGTPSRPAAPPALYSGPATVRVCFYGVPAAERGTGKPAGDFVSGRKLTAGQWAAVKREVEAAAPATPCTTPATRFALVRTDAGETYVELDHCRRILAPTTAGHDTLRQGSTALVALLAG
jgi:hypothetical protein